MTEPQGDQILYNNLLAEVQKVHAAMAKAAEDARVREESVTRFREVLVSSMDRFSDEMAENRKQMFAIADASLSANQITLPSGTYYVYFCAPALLVDRHQSRLVSTSGSSVSIIGQTANASSAANGFSTSLGSGVFSVPSSSTTVVELQHKCQTTKATNGLGPSAGFTTEVYAFVEITKVK